MSDGVIDFILGMIAGLVTALGVVALVYLLVAKDANQAMMY